MRIMWMDTNNKCPKSIKCKITVNRIKYNFLGNSSLLVLLLCVLWERDRKWPVQKHVHGVRSIVLNLMYIVHHITTMVMIMVFMQCHLHEWTSCNFSIGTINIYIYYINTMGCPNTMHCYYSWATTYSHSHI